jgi:hypothetical protein
VVFDAVGAQLGTPVPPPGLPGPFALDDPDRLGGLLTGAGLIEVVVSELPTPLRDSSVEVSWTRTAALAGPLAKRLALLPTDAAASCGPVSTRRPAPTRPRTASTSPG